MDSAVARFNKPYGKDAAPYLYERAGAKTAVKDFRGAVADYNDFYDAMMGQVSAEFYLIRTQAEMQCRMFQQAINDINKAIKLDPQNVNYWVEKEEYVYVSTKQQKLFKLSKKQSLLIRKTLQPIVC